MSDDLLTVERRKAYALFAPPPFIASFIVQVSSRCRFRTHLGITLAKLLVRSVGLRCRRSGVPLSAVDVADMMHWVFHRVTDASGSGWRWQCKDEGGGLVAAAQRVYAAYPDCLADAMRHGYLSDVKTCCGNLEYL